MYWQARRGLQFGDLGEVLLAKACQVVRRELFEQAAMSAKKRNAGRS